MNRRERRNKEDGEDAEAHRKMKRPRMTIEERVKLRENEKWRKEMSSV